MKSQRQLQIGENIKRIMSEIFLRGDILSTQGSYITVLEADVSPDAKNVKIYLDIFGNEEKQNALIKALNKASPSFRAQLAKKISLRIVPEIFFILDKTQDKALKIEDLINKESQNFKEE
jgi:ribosome-binding factor A